MLIYFTFVFEVIHLCSASGLELASTGFIMHGNTLEKCCCLSPGKEHHSILYIIRQCIFVVFPWLVIYASHDWGTKEQQWRKLSWPNKILFLTLSVDQFIPRSVKKWKFHHLWNKQWKWKFICYFSLKL